ncbi:uncharacterized protein TDEL_0D00650 [Torulaspora delbrueckii]|uniref:Uncharacterized protein n=1 Tax=Torulaspora delbrueckii TaxID=4950 RepID=G8ZSQ5_TORDE|nr:hypothetical protein TDEL_0D00650 [Torulaspora delbrueckii]CCE91649.1 hypothetical protein TDEL_0D00650 [Torulaspora delbrueckii]
MALHNYIYLKHKSHDPSCHKLLARDHDSRPTPVPSVSPQDSTSSVSSAPAASCDKTTTNQCKTT